MARNTVPALRKTRTERGPKGNLRTTLRTGSPLRKIKMARPLSKENTSAVHLQKNKKNVTTDSDRSIEEAKPPVPEIGDPSKKECAKPDPGCAE